MLQPSDSLAAIPEETQRVARAAFPKGSLAMRLRDELGRVYLDEEFKELFPERGQPAASPALLALVTVLQYVEGLTDRQAADAVRGRIDWKYALGLELTDPGFDHSVLSEFRDRLLVGRAEERLLTVLLTAFRERGLIQAKGRQRTDSTHVLAAIRTLTRLELVGETLRAALNELAIVVPDWLKTVVSAEWYSRYGRRFDSLHLPESSTRREELAQQIGEDGYRLMTAAFAVSAPAEVHAASSLEVLRRVWIQQYQVDNAQATPRLQLRASENQPPAEKRIHSPYDAEARYAWHNAVDWIGYKVHLTESCDAEAKIHVITHVETTPATQQDVDASAVIHADLARQNLAPSEHLVDAAYISADLLVDSAQDFGFTLLGPATKLHDVSWQAREQTGFDSAHFQIDWDAKQVTCPQGQPSVQWKEPVLDETGNAGIVVAFPAKICQACSARPLCTRSDKKGRTLRFRTRAEHEALQRRRAEETTAEFREKTQPRQGIEGTISQAVRGFGIRRARYVGLAKTHLQAVMTAAAINVGRFWDYLCGHTPVHSRTTPFAALAAT